MLARQLPMAEPETARPRGARTRPKGFLAFCAVVTALIGLFSMNPLVASAGRGNGSDDDRGRARSGESLQLESVSTAGPATDRSNDAALQRIVQSGQPVYCGAGTQPLVALTFDDGPGAFTGRTLDLLAERGMTATFFVAGKLVGVPWIDDSLVRRAADLGEIGDHSWDHISMVGLSQDELDAQIARTRQVAAKAAGERVLLFRPPLGAHDERVRDYLRSIGMLNVLWSLESGDSQGNNAVKIFRTVRRGLSAGDIVLLHENRGTTQKALPEILDLIERRGLRTVTVSELLTADPPTAGQLRQRSCPA
jgi:peptidoglycan/xylan/chitin deacetylase (PgdA/CDA1 family)